MVFRVHDEALVDLHVVLLGEIIERLVAPVPGGLHLYGADALPADDEEVDLVGVLPLRPGRLVAVPVEVETMAVGGEGLRHGVLYHHALVDAEPVRDERPVQFVARLRVAPHHLGHEQAGVAQVHFEIVAVLVQAERDLGGRHVGAHVCHHGLAEEGDRSRQAPGPRRLVDGRVLEARIVVRELAGDGFEDLCRAVVLLVVVLAEVLLVEVEDRSLRPVDAGEVAATGEELHGLRHAAHGHVGAEVAHDTAMDRVGQRLARLERLPYGRRGDLVAHGPEVLLEVHGVHLRALLFGGDEDVLHVLADRYERAGLDVVVAPVLHEGLDGLAGRREQLDLVEYDGGIALGQALPLQQEEVAEERIEVADVSEVLAHVGALEREVDQQVVCVVLLRETLRDGALADAPGALDQQGRPAVRDPFPFREPVVRLSPEEVGHRFLLLPKSTNVLAYYCTKSKNACVAIGFRTRKR